MSKKLSIFQRQKIAYMETVDVKTGVSCDVYAFTSDNTKDLAIVSVATRKRTPLQKVLGGEKTVEGYVSGLGKLTIRTSDGIQNEYNFPNDDATEIRVNIGDIMQWKSIKDLVFYEVCTPPYVDGRFQNIDEAEL